MKQSPKLQPCLWDALVVAAVLALAFLCAGAFWMQGTQTEGDLVATVSVDGQEAERFTVSDGQRTYTNRGYTLHILVLDDGVQVSASDCPTQDCVHMGVIEQAGQSIVCLPARIVIQLERTGSDSGVDAVIG
jgi:hypothetical protein